MSSTDITTKNGLSEANESKKALSDSESEPSQAFIEYTEDERRKAVRALDWSVLPIMTMFYFLSFLDRANIGNARVAGLQADLKMTNHQYSVAVTVLYVPYICAELPANLILRKIGPKILMPTLLTIWGIIVTLQGVVTSYAGLVVIRAILGAVEGPMFPGIVLYLSGFYTRKELSVRIAVFFSSASLSGAFSGLLAAAISNMDGIGGKPGWAWIFILEGLFSFLVGIIGYFVVPSTPRGALFLNDRQKDLIMHRLQKDRPSINPVDRFSVREIFRSATSPHVILVFVMFYMLGTNLYGLALFLPSIVNELGFGANHSQLLSVGPFAAAFFLTLISAVYSDRWNNRALPNMILYGLGMIGYAMYLGVADRWSKYGSLFLSVSGVYASAPVISAWMANNSEPYYRRATSVALGYIATNSGGITSTWLFPTTEAPKYTKTTIINLVFAILVVVLSGVNALMLARANRIKKARRNELLEPYGDLTDSDGLKAWAELGDKHPDFVYTL